MRIHGYCLKPRGVCKERRLRNTELQNDKYKDYEILNHSIICILLYTLENIDFGQSLLVLVKYGHGMVSVLMLLMWLSLVGAVSDMLQYPPCVFNPLCTCSKSVPDLGIVICLNVPLPRLPPLMNGSKAFMLHLENNGMRYIEPCALLGTGK